MIYPGNRGGIINPNREIYYSFTSVFKPDDTLDDLHIDERTVWINGILVRGAINSSDSLFIDNNIFNCDIPLDESLPTYLSDWDDNEKVNVLTKCFSREDFYQYIAKYPYGIHFYSERDLLTEYLATDKFNWIDGGNTRTDNLTPLEYNVKFSNEKLTKEANSIYEIMKKYLASRDPKEKQIFYDEYHKYLVRMAMIYNQQIQNNIFVDRDAYFEFMKKNGRIFGAGILGEPILI